MRNVIHNIQYKTYIHFEQLFFSSITVNEHVKNCTKYLKNCTYTYKILKKKMLSQSSNRMSKHYYNTSIPIISQEPARKVKF